MVSQEIIYEAAAGFAGIKFNEEGQAEVDTTHLSWKIGFMVVVFTITLAPALLPLKFKGAQKGNFFLKLATSFSGGVFLSIFLIHLFPELIEGYNTYLAKDIERMQNEWIQEHESTPEEERPEMPSFTNFFISRFPFIMIFVGYIIILLLDKLLFDEAHDTKDDDPIEQSDDAVLKVFAKQSKQQNLNDTLDDQDQDDDGGVSDLNVSTGSAHALNLSPLALSFALGAHALFEGIPIGIQSDKSTMQNLMLGIVVHKWAEALYLGINLNKNFNSQFKPIFIIAFIFAFATPLGVILGMVIKSVLSEIVEITFTAFACGTFLYIGASEVISEEFIISPKLFWKLVAYLLGGAFIFTITVLE